MLFGGSDGSAQGVLNTDWVTGFGHAVQAIASANGEVLYQSPPQSAKFRVTKRNFTTGGVKVIYAGDLSIASVGPRQANIRVGCGPESLTAVIALDAVGTLFFAMAGAQSGAFLIFLLIGLAVMAWQLRTLKTNVPKALAEQIVVAAQVASQAGPGPAFQAPRAPEQSAGPTHPGFPPSQTTASKPSNSAAPQSVTPNGAPGETDVAVVMRKLIELRDMGALTPQEFEAKKAELLRRL